MQENFKLNVSLTKAYLYQVEIYHRSAQVIRFRLTCATQQLDIEKRLLQKTHQWKVVSANFPLTTQEAMQNFNIICTQLEEAMRAR
ncbi:MAG: hypothetical protein H7334_01535 [Ferruginibacter sp.]|nr:hypothetical protein [Ferruginibacter sp.]